MDAVVDDLTNYLGPDPNATGDGGFTKVYQFTTGQTWTLGTSGVLDSTFGFSRQDQTVLGPDFQAGNFGLDELGIPGTNDAGIGDPRYAGYPQFNTGFSALGNRDGWNPIYRDERTYSFTTNFTKLKGRHELRGGYMVNFLWLNHWQPETGNPRGRFTFAQNATALRGGQSSNFYNQYAAFLLGLTGSTSDAVNKSVQDEEMTGREWQHGLYVRDRWNVSDKLTLDLGLRWEYYPIMSRANHGLERLDFSTLEVMIGGLGGNDAERRPEGQLGQLRATPGCDLPLERKHRAAVRATASPTTRFRGHACCAATTSTRMSSRRPSPTTRNSAGTRPSTRGFRRSPCPTSAAARVKLPNAPTMWTPEVGNVDRSIIHSWNAAFERRLPWNLSADIAYVGTKLVGGYAALDVNAPTTLGGGNASRPYAPMGRTNPLLSWGQRLTTNYQSLQFALNRPFTNGLLIKGAYTLGEAFNMSQNDEDGRVTVHFNTPSQYRCQLRACRLRQAAQPASRVHVPVAVAERQRVGKPGQAVDRTTGS